MDTPNTQDPQEQIPQAQPPVTPTDQASTSVENPAIMPTLDAHMTDPTISQDDTPPSVPDTEPLKQMSSLPGNNNKKTVAVAAAGISAMLIILGVYAMTRETFKTNTNQYAASNETTVKKQEKTIKKEISTDPVEQNLQAADQELKKVDQDTTTIDDTLQATPDPLN